MRIVVLLLLLAAAGDAQQVRLYLKDGGFHLVREYQVTEDRVRYYSTERSDWEEIPLSIVDLKKTQEEIKSKVEESRKQAAIADAEDKFEREQEAEIARIPVDAGVYFVAGEKVEGMKAAELKVVSDKKRSLLKILTPMPVIAGKSTVEIDGESALKTFSDPRPYFYIRLSTGTQFGIVRAKPKKGSRVVELWQTVPVSNELFIERDEVEVFRQQFRNALFKVWPAKPLEPGEYSIVEYTPGEGNTRAWDFRIVTSGQ